MTIIITKTMMMMMMMMMVIMIKIIGRAIAEVVSSRPGFDPRSGHVGFVVDKVVEYYPPPRFFWFPLPALFPPTAPHSLIISSSDAM
jgi:hypothetical protein